ncbi:MAG: cadmium-translocating P-type ATPase [Phycisphaeraceae bacterium]|nr:cadmium-translocating P-type ATPase [Phycisphaeraceae bacterium]
MRSTFTIPLMDCPTEEAVIRNGLKSVAGVESLTFDLFNRRLTVTHSLPDEWPIVTALRRVGMEPAQTVDGAKTPLGPEVERRATKPVVASGGEPMKVPIASRRELVMLGLSGVLAVAAEVVAWTTKTERSWPVLVMSAAAVLLGGLPTLRKGLIAIRTFTLNINFLMTVAVAGAFAAGEYPEAAVVVVLFAVAELIEKYSLERARNAVRALMEMAPETAFVKQLDGSWKEAPAAEVPQGTIVRVRPGERLPLDGVVVAGESAVNQAPITGESVPVDKAEGDQVFAGTINESGVLEFRTTGGRDQTTLARIIRTVQEAQAARAPTQRFVDRFARIYTPVVCILAVLVALAPWLAFDQPFYPWLYKALVLLVIACPCALVISTPVTVVSGLAAAARRGILIKGGAYLEEGRRLRILALDKTGTITEGRPRLTDVVPLGGKTPEEVLRIAAALDAGSDHPVARAVVAGWEERGVGRGGPLPAVEGFKSITGRGVEGRLDGAMYLVGNHRLAEERMVCTPAVEAELGKLEAQGKTAIVVARESPAQVLGVLAVADTPRETSVEAVRALHALGVRTVMLSGDNQTTAEAIARAVGIDDARGGLLPEDKIASIDEMIAEHGAGAVGMAGDGVNDAPALAKSDIGFAMGAAGTDVALETADVALMKDDLRAVPEFIRLSRRTSAILKQNITISLAAKGIFFVLALVGLATLWMAVLADVGATLVVIANGLRVMRLRAGSVYTRQTLPPVPLGSEERSGPTSER